MPQNFSPPHRSTAAKPDHDRWLTQREALQYLGLKSRSTIRRKLMAGLMPSPVRLPGGTLRWKLSALSQWAEAQPEQRY
jgi:prophage regulatory protein